MYRLIFNTKTAKWQVQLQTWGFIWRTVNTPPLKDYKEAAAYVESVGLSNVYRDYRTAPAAKIWEGGYFDPGLPQVVHTRRLA